MKRPFNVSVLSLVLAACAGPQQEQSATPRTIEPGSSSTRASSSSSSSGGEETGEFVLSKRSARRGLSAEEQSTLHLADEWWRFRAEFLRMSVGQVRERDQEISERQPPPQFWDQQTAVEAASVWGSLCNECHGGRRAIGDAMKMPPPPSSWGRGTGLFFGQRRPYETLFAIVSGGGPERNGKKSEMPAWRGRLAREQIWAILYFLEYQSGGIEGRFPPSLYPRMRSEEN
jgi:mono/diheme cytochrome c family protein